MSCVSVRVLSFMHWAWGMSYAPECEGSPVKCRHKPSAWGEQYVVSPSRQCSCLGLVACYKSLKLQVQEGSLSLAGTSRALGLSNELFVLGDSVVLTVLGQVAFMPVLVLAAKLCPEVSLTVMQACLKQYIRRCRHTWQPQGHLFISQVCSVSILPCAAL